MAMAHAVLALGAATISHAFQALLLLRQLEPMADRLAVGLLDGREVGRGPLTLSSVGMGNSGGWPREQGGVSKACVRVCDLDEPGAARSTPRCRILQCPADRHSPRR